jgi:hypothetical protein
MERGSITLFNDFGAATLAEAGAQLLLTMRQSGDLTKCARTIVLARSARFLSAVSAEAHLGI